MRQLAISTGLAIAVAATVALASASASGARHHRTASQSVNRDDTRIVNALSYRERRRIPTWILAFFSSPRW
jgi:hypothetical protein